MKLSQKMCFLTSDNPAAAGRFLQDNCEVKPHDSTTMYCTAYMQWSHQRQGMAEREHGSYPTQLCAMTEHRHVKKEKKERHRCNKSAV